MSEIFSGVSSNYNAFAVQLTRRMYNHLQFMANYTWSHALDFGQNSTTFSDTNDLLTPNNIRPEYGNSNFNVPNRLVVSGVAESPWKVHGVGRNTIVQKRTINMDTRLSKKIKFGERYSAEVLGEAFNIFNHQNVTGVNNTGYIIGGTAAAPTLSFNSSFGHVTNSNSNFAYTPRQIQIGFRFFF
jgi:hypothetical protein